jgi:tetratricopeptide (TPR) repeat protein
MHHEGYEGDLITRKKKTERNITLLRKQLKEEGDDPYILYQLGKSYYMQEEHQTACEWFEKALYFDLDPHLEYVQDMVESYGYALINSEQYETALQLSGVYNEFAVNADFVYLMGLIYMNNARFVDSIQEFIKATHMKEYKMDGVNSYRAFYNIGVIYECLNNPEEARKYYNKCGDYKPAKMRQL